MDFKFGEISVKSLDLISFHFKFENSILLFNWSQLDLILLQCIKKGPEILFLKSSVMQLTKSIVEWELFLGKTHQDALKQRNFIKLPTYSQLDMIHCFVYYFFKIYLSGGPKNATFAANSNRCQRGFTHMGNLTKISKTLYPQCWGKTG